MRGSAAARLLGLRVRIPPGAWMSVTCTCCCRGLCVGQITRTGESYRLWCAYLSVIITKLMVGFRDYANAPKKKKMMLLYRLKQYFIVSSTYIPDIFRLSHLEMAKISLPLWVMNYWDTCIYGDSFHHEPSTMRRPWPPRFVAIWQKKQRVSI